MSKIKVLDRDVSIISVQEEDFICLTDIARYKDPERTDYLILNWLRNRNTIEFLGIWEQLNNPGFNPIEFDGIKNQAGLNSFILTAKQWIEKTGAIGITSKAGRYGGTYSHKDILPFRKCVFFPETPGCRASKAERKRMRNETATIEKRSAGCGECGSGKEDHSIAIRRIKP